MIISRMLNLSSILISTCLSISITGCAVEYPHPNTIVLQQPKLGESLIYFLRAPHDSGQLTIEWQGNPLEVSLGQNERKFFHVSGSDDKRVALIGVMGIPGAGPVPLLGRKSIVRNRVWTECTELDARGLITISHPAE